MVKIAVKLYKSGCLEKFAAQGHSGLSTPGQDVLCSGVSVLLRTVGKLVTLEKTVISSGRSGDSGEMYLEISSIPVGKELWLKGITDFFVRALRDLAEEYPDNMTLKIYY